MFETCKSISELDEAYQKEIKEFNIRMQQEKSKIVDAYYNRKHTIASVKEDFKKVPVEYVTDDGEEPKIYAHYRLIKGKAKSNQIIINQDGTIFI